MQTLIAQVLAAWRRAERLTEELEPGTPEHAQAVMACERLRDLYHELAHNGGVAPEAEVERVLAELGVERT